MGISFKSTFNAQARIKEIKDRNTKRLETAMVDAKAQILARTSQGEGADGAFKAYSKGYEKFKVSKGRSGTPDLTFTGSMLRAMQTAVTDNGGDKLLGRIYFLADQANKARWNQALRNFFSLTSEQIATIQRKLRGQ